MHGAEAVMLRAIQACAARGSRITVLVPSIVADEGLREALAEINGIQILALPYRAAGGHKLRTALVRLYNSVTLFKLVRFVRKEKVNTIYSNTSVTVLGADLARRTNIRHIWHWHESVDAAFGWHPSLQALYRRLARRAETLICISYQQQREWEEALGTTLTNAQVIYNPIKQISSIQSDKSAQREGIRIGYIGRFEPRKNIPLLMHAFEQLHSTHPHMSLWLCGAIDDKDWRYISGITALQNPDVVILPQTPDVNLFYQSIDILVIPSWRETMPLVALEAMQAGVCVLQTTKSGMAELLENNKETLFFSPDNPNELIRLLQKCKDETYRQSIAKAGQAKAARLAKEQQFDQQIQTILCE